RCTPMGCTQSTRRCHTDRSGSTWFHTTIYDRRKRIRPGYGVGPGQNPGRVTKREYQSIITTASSQDTNRATCTRRNTHECFDPRAISCLKASISYYCLRSGVAFSYGKKKDRARRYSSGNESRDRL